MEQKQGVNKWPGETLEAHPEVFTTIPPQPENLKPGQFTETQIKQFFEEGYVIVENFFDCNQELEPVRESINILVDELAQKLYNAGKIKSLYKDVGLFKRLTKIEAEFPWANILMHKMGGLPPAFRTLWSNERLLNLMEQLLNTKDIIGHPVWNLRTKTPKNEATTVPWHQGSGLLSLAEIFPSYSQTNVQNCIGYQTLFVDVGYLDNDSYDVLQPTAWIPFLDTNEINGCMQVVQGGHRTGRVATHQCCHGGTWYVMLKEDEIERTLEVDMSEDVVTCAVPYGGVLFINNMIPHRSLNNLSQDVRWSVDLRWQRADKKTGFYGLKEGIQLRSEDPNFKIDWEPFVAVNRNKKQAEYLQKEEDEFDTSISGPWMTKWEIVHVNRHTDNLEKVPVGSSWHSHKP